MPDGKILMQKWAHFNQDEIPQQGDILSEERRVKSEK